MASGILIAVTFFLFANFAQGFWFEMTSKITILEKNPLVLIGDNLTLTCEIVTDDIVGNASMFYTRRSGENISSEYWRMISPNEGILEFPISSKENAGQYCCEMTHPDTIGEFDCRYVRVEHRPMRVEDFHCVVFDYDYKMICNWSLGVEYIEPTHINVDLEWNYAATANEPNYKCPNMERLSCYWNREDASFNDHIMLFYVTVSNTEGGGSATSRSLIDTSRIVKPSGLDSFNGRPINDSCVEIEWRHHKVFREQLCRIQYSCPNEVDNSTLTLDRPGSEGKTELCDILPHTLCTFDGYVKPGKDGFLSDKTSIQLMTNTGDDTY